mgnify:CR=1 FL=1
MVTGKLLWGSYYEVKSGLSEEDYIAFPYGKTVVEGADTKESSSIGLLQQLRRRIMLENVRLSFQGIWSHKMRSFLTMLGIIIGIASIISIVSTIKGTNEQIKQNLIGAGNNNVTVSLKQGDGDYWMDNGLTKRRVETVR